MVTNQGVHPAQAGSRRVWVKPGLGRMAVLPGMGQLLRIANGRCLCFGLFAAQGQRNPGSCSMLLSSSYCTTHAFLTGSKPLKSITSISTENTADRGHSRSHTIKFISGDVKDNIYGQPKRSPSMSLNLMVNIITSYGPYLHHWLYGCLKAVQTQHSFQQQNWTTRSPEPYHALHLQPSSGRRRTS